MATELDVRAVGTSDPTAATLLSSYAGELADHEVEREPGRIETIASEYEDPDGTFLVVYDDVGSRTRRAAGATRASAWTRRRR
jgi:hypothetical protein